jgi:thiosulfate/3-mercaptopyruvate sulfurtransferase
MSTPKKWIDVLGAFMHTKRGSFLKEFRATRPLLELALAGLAAFFALAALAQGPSPQRAITDPWSPAHLVEPADFARELSSKKPDSRPTIVYVGFRTLFEGGHIPGATFHGTASTEAGLASLKTWAASLPRTTDVVLYCGCCPFDRCPNLRPAFALFRDLGFTHLRVLALRTSFAADWAEKNYPIEKGL